MRKLWKRWKTFTTQFKELKASFEASRSRCEEQIMALQGGGAHEVEPDSAMEGVAEEVEQTHYIKLDPNTNKQMQHAMSGFRTVCAQLFKNKRQGGQIE